MFNAYNLCNTQDDFVLKPICIYTIYICIRIYIYILYIYIYIYTHTCTYIIYYIIYIIYMHAGRFAIRGLAVIVKTELPSSLQPTTKAGSRDSHWKWSEGQCHTETDLNMGEALIQKAKQNLTWQPMHENCCIGICGHLKKWKVQRNVCSLYLHHIRDASKFSLKRRLDLKKVGIFPSKIKYSWRFCCSGNAVIVKLCWLQPCSFEE